MRLRPPFLLFSGLVPFSGKRQRGHFFSFSFSTTRLGSFPTKGIFNVFFFFPQIMGAIAPLGICSTFTSGTHSLLFSLRWEDGFSVFAYFSDYAKGCSFLSPLPIFLGGTLVVLLFPGSPASLFRYRKVSEFFFLFLLRGTCPPFSPAQYLHLAGFVRSTACGPSFVWLRDCPFSFPPSFCSGRVVSFFFLVESFFSIPFAKTSPFFLFFGHHSDVLFLPLPRVQPFLRNFSVSRWYWSLFLSPLPGKPFFLSAQWCREPSFFQAGWKFFCVLALFFFAGSILGDPLFPEPQRPFFFFFFDHSATSVFFPRVSEYFEMLLFLLPYMLMVAFRFFPW